MEHAIIILCMLSLYGTVRTGCFLNAFGYVVLAILLVLAWEHKVFICVLLLSCIALGYLVPKIIDYFMYKDETPEERAERLKLNKMIEEWRQRNNF